MSQPKTEPTDHPAWARFEAWWNVVQHTTNRTKQEEWIIYRAGWDGMKATMDKAESERKFVTNQDPPHGTGLG